MGGRTCATAILAYMAQFVFGLGGILEMGKMTLIEGKYLRQAREFLQRSAQFSWVRINVCFNCSERFDDVDIFTVGERELDGKVKLEMWL